MKPSMVSCLALSLLCLGSSWDFAVGFAGTSSSSSTSSISTTTLARRWKCTCTRTCTAGTRRHTIHTPRCPCPCTGISIRTSTSTSTSTRIDAVPVFHRTGQVPVLSTTRHRPSSKRLKRSLSSLLRSLPHDSDASPTSNSTKISVAGEDDAASVLNNSSTSSPVQIPDTSALPSYRKLIVFTLTTILIWISEPLLSLVDTAIVGMTTSSKSAVLQIAALGPATTLYDSAIYMTYFLAIAATNLISPALAEKNWLQLRKSTSHLMGLAVMFGSLVTIVACGAGKSLITSMVGTSSVTHDIIPLAASYAWIRAAVAPFCVVDFVAQSFCLATLDTKTPAIAVAVASLVNIVGDSLLVPRWGIQGAAVATAMATVSSCLILVRKVRKQTKQWKTFQEIEEAQVVIQTNQKSSTNDDIDNIVDTTSASYTDLRPLKTRVTDGSIEMVDDNKDRPFGAPKTKAVNGAAIPQEIPFWSLPDKKSLIDLLKLAGPIFFVMMGKIACYSIMTVRATNFGIIPLAAHNIMMRVFFFFACFGDSLSQATQTFFPQVKLENRGQLIKRLLYLSTGIGLCISQFSYFILTQLGGFLTKDTAIIQQMAQHAPWVASAVLLHPFIMLLEGTVLARRDLLYLVGMYITTMALHFGMVFLPTTFRGLWQVFFAFQAIRLTQFTGRLIWKSRGSQKSAAAAIILSSQQR